MKKIMYIACVSSLLLSLFISCNTSIQAETTNNISWSVILNCNESGGEHDFVVFGEAPDATDGPPHDSYDIVEPPAPMTPYIRTWFNDNLPSPYDFLWEDYRSYPDTEKVWNLTVQWMPSSGSSPTTVTINWDIDKVHDSEYTSFSFCAETGTPLKNMFFNNYYSFNCPPYIPQNFKIICGTNNLPPATPQKPQGETSGKTGVEYTYSSTTTDPDNNQVYYQWNWGDGVTSAWLGPYTSGQITETTHTWTKKGNYQITVKAKDFYGAESNWSDSLPITMPVSQNYVIDEMAALIHCIIQFLRGEYAGMTFIQILRMAQ
ncbi:PKD domain protein [uncultured archaeon]|nr:PKD domain protein [uncultured archaeon]